jgi:hypothetical protein
MSCELWCVEVDVWCCVVGVKCEFFCVVFDV